jgi:hypothetical protein
VDFGRLYAIHTAPAFFVTRAKSNFDFRRLYSNPVDKSAGMDSLRHQTSRRHNAAGLNRRMRKTAGTVVWEGAGNQSGPRPDQEM